MLVWASVKVFTASWQVQRLHCGQAGWSARVKCGMEHGSGNLGFRVKGSGLIGFRVVVTPSPEERAGVCSLQR